MLFHALCICFVCLREKCGTSDKEEISEANSDRKRISEAISEKEGRSEAISDGVEKSEAISERKEISEAISDKEERSEAIPDKEGRSKSKGQFKEAIGQDKDIPMSTALAEFQAKLLGKTITQAAGMFVFAMVLIVIAVLVNFYPETWIWNLWAQGYKLSDVAVVNSGYFNIVFGSCISSNFLYVILHYFQVSKPEQEKQAKIEEEGEKHEIDVKNDLLEQETPV